MSGAWQLEGRLKKGVLLYLINQEIKSHYPIFRNPDENPQLFFRNTVWSDQLTNHQSRPDFTRNASG